MAATAKSKAEDDLLKRGTEKMPKDSDRQPGDIELAVRRKIVFVSGRMTRGKSVFVRYVCERASSRGTGITIADINRTNTSLSAYLDNVINPPDGDDASVMDWIGRLALSVAQDADSVDAVVDLCGGDPLLARHGREMQMVSALEGIGLRPVLVHLLGPSMDDIGLLSEVEASFAPASTILVLNTGTVPATVDAKRVFQPIREHEVYRAIVARGAKEVVMPRLDPMWQVERRRLPFEAAKAGRVATGQEPLGLWVPQQVGMWLLRMDEAFSVVADWLP